MHRPKFQFFIRNLTNFYDFAMNFMRIKTKAAVYFQKKSIYGTYTADHEYQDTLRIHLYSTWPTTYNWNTMFHLWFTMALRSGPLLSVHWARNGILWSFGDFFFVVKNEKHPSELSARTTGIKYKKTKEFWLLQLFLFFSENNFTSCIFENQSRPWVIRNFKSVGGGGRVNINYNTWLSFRVNKKFS